MDMDFVALDFETANRYPNSACSIGLVKFIGGEIEAEYYRLIKPPKMSFDAMNIQIHGIRPKNVMNEPTFDYLWNEEIVSFIGDLPLVAHNASFDMNVLRALLGTYDLACGPLRYICTVTGSRRAYPELENHKLSTVSNHLGISLRHHQALDDARACGKILADIFKKFECKSFEELCVKKGYCLKIF